MGILRSTALPLLLVAAVFGAACSGGSSSTPTQPDGAPLEFAGTITSAGVSAHDIVLPDDSLLEVTLAELNLLLFDTSQADPNNFGIGLGLGQRDDDGECDLTSNFVVTEGQLTIYRLSANSYCLTLFDPGFFPEDAVIGYRLTLELTS